MFPSVPWSLSKSINAWHQIALPAQSFGSAEVEAFHDDSDFSSDDHSDLSVATPSIGGAQNQLILYFGNSDGTLKWQAICTVFGQILASCVDEIDAIGGIAVATRDGNGTGAQTIMITSSIRRYSRSRGQRIEQVNRKHSDL